MRRYVDNVVKVKIDDQWVSLPALSGSKGDKGDPGEKGTRETRVTPEQQIMKI